MISSRSSLGKLRSDILIFRGACGVYGAFGYVLGTIGFFSPPSFSFLCFPFGLFSISF